jgi:hypothetical protein
VRLGEPPFTERNESPMSTTTQPTPPATQTPKVNEVKIYSHSALFYWWPVWAVGFVLGVLSLIQGYRLAVVPPDTEVEERRIKDSIQKVLVLPPGASFDKDKDLHLRTTTHKSYGVLFATVLLLVIFITNVPLRGMWSVMIIMLIVLMSIIFALAGWWDWILSNINLLDIRINAGGYFFLALALFIIWLVTILLFDRQIYIIFQPGSFKVCLEIGSGEKQYDTIGMTIEKERSDLFRHWILGLGSGDMVVKTSGAERHEFRLNNVLFIGRKLQLVEEMQRDRQVRAV